jgi:hypothetical protein
MKHLSRFAPLWRGITLFCGLIALWWLVTLSASRQPSATPIIIPLRISVKVIRL